MEILIACLIAYAVAAPDRVTLAATRGLSGAVRGAATGKTPSSKKSKPRTRALTAGWREGVAAAHSRREAGRDLWSRGSRIGGRVWGGGVSLVSGARGSIQARRDRSSTPELEEGTTSPAAVPARRGWSVASLVKRPRTAPTSEGTADPAKPVDQADDAKPVDQADAKPALTTDTKPTPTTPEKTPEPKSEPAMDATTKTPETAPAPAPASTPATPSSPSEIGVIRMPENNIELTDIDALDKYLKGLQNVFTDLAEAAERVRKSGKHLASQWEGADWGTRGLDRAVSDICEEIAGFKVPNVDAFATGRREIATARALGENAESIKARGKTDAFTGK
jgi:hypothetical protein